MGLPANLSIVDAVQLVTSLKLNRNSALSSAEKSEQNAASSGWLAHDIVP